ncbi:MAG: hypothetical protein MUC56_06365 [Thermoanaerobaculales bacterium]|jgi:hypothetical protein|nr:hypothetical protein [Thermoanaerobaculales bacterium]
MKHSHSITVIGAVAVLTLAAALPVQAVQQADAETTGDESCCFSNPRFAGICRVTTGPEETCADVLAYLNNPSSTGRTYCANTKIRGGWSQVACDETTSSCVPVDPAPAFTAD